MIQAAVGSAAGVGGPWTTRSGVAEYAVLSTTASAARFAAASSKCASWGVWSPSPECRYSVLYHRKEVGAMHPRMFDRPKALGKIRPVLERFERRLRIRIVVRDLGACVRLGDAAIGEQEGHRPRRHGGAAIGVARELSAAHPLARAAGGAEALGERRRFARSDHPADD